MLNLKIFSIQLKNNQTTHGVLIEKKANTFAWALIYLNLNLVTLFCFFHLSVSVSQISFLFLQLSFSDLPKCVNLISFQLEIIALFSLSVQLLTQSNNVLLQLIKSEYFIFIKCVTKSITKENVV